MSRGEDGQEGGTRKGAALLRFPTNHGDGYQSDGGGFTVILTKQELEKMQSVNIGAVDADTLPDVGGMAFQSGLSREARIANFMQGAGNLYCFCVGGVGVKIEFSERGPSLQDTLADFLIRQKSGL